MRRWANARLMFDGEARNDKRTRGVQNFFSYTVGPQTTNPRMIFWAMKRRPILGFKHLFNELKATQSDRKASFLFGSLIGS